MAMRWPLALLALLLTGALLLPLAFPVAADRGDDGDDEGDREDDRDEKRDGRGGRGDDDRDGDRDEDDGDEDEREDDGGPREDRRDGKPRDRGHQDKAKDKAKDEHGDHDRDGGAEARPKAPAERPSAGRPDVRVAQDYVAAPGLLTFTFRVTNHGQGQAKDVHLSGDLPDTGTWALADVTRCELAATAVDCELGDLDAGESVLVEARSVIVGDVPPFTNVVQVYSPMQSAGAPSSP
jgi:hypothetical protein